MNSLTKRALGAQVRFVAMLAVLIFASAGSLRYWQGWIYWFVFSGATTWLARHFLKHDRRLSSVGCALACVRSANSARRSFSAS